MSFEQSEAIPFYQRPAPLAVQWLGRRLHSIPDGPLRSEYLEKKILSAPVMPLVRIFGCALRESATGLIEARIIVDMLGRYVDEKGLPPELIEELVQAADELHDSAVLTFLQGKNLSDDEKIPSFIDAKNAPKGSLAAEGESLGRRKTLARTASGDLIEKLIIDPHPDVIENLLINPRLKEVNVIRLAGHMRTHAEILQRIARSRFQNRIDVRRALALNPNSPSGIAVRFLSALSRADLLQIAHDQRIEEIVRSAARNLIEAKPPRLPLSE